MKFKKTIFVEKKTLLARRSWHVRIAHSESRVCSSWSLIAIKYQTITLLGVITARATRGRGAPGAFRAAAESQVMQKHRARVAASESVAFVYSVGSQRLYIANFASGPSIIVAFAREETRSRRLSRCILYCRVELKSYADRNFHCAPNPPLYGLSARMRLNGTVVNADHPRCFERNNYG